MFTPGGLHASEASLLIVPLPRAHTPGGCAMPSPAASLSPWRARGEAWHLPSCGVGLFSNLVSIFIFYFLYREYPTVSSYLFLGVPFSSVDGRSTEDYAHFYFKNHESLSSFLI